MNKTSAALTIPSNPELTLLGNDAESARHYAESSLAPATRRAYQTDVDAFSGRCRGRGVEILPAEPEVVAAFLAHEAERGLRAS